MVTVGTPDYISPEVLMSNEGKGTYGVECDFWSLGITLYEMLIGQPPFYADTLLETYNQIMNHKQFFTIPEDMNLSVHAVGLLRKLVCDKSERIKSFDELCRHPFFAGFDWTSPRKC
jgi:serine/threonine protein kinase